MKICVTSQGKDLAAQVDPRFGRCQYFMVVDMDSLVFEAIANPNIEAMGGAGVQSGQLVAAKVHRIAGCPMGARDLFLKVPRLFGLPNPMLDRRDAALFIYHSADKSLCTLKNRLLPDKRSW